jgi:hypothetical protein
MSNVTWFKSNNLDQLIHLTKRLGVFVKLCDGGYGWTWGQVMQNADPADPQAVPTEYCIEHNTTLMEQSVHPYVSRKWTVAATAENTPAYYLPSDTEHLNPFHVVTAVGDPLLSEEDLALVTIFELDGFYERAD